MQRYKKLSLYDTYIFFENMHQLIKSGVPLSKALDLVDIKNKKLLEDLKKGIQNGVSISKALENTNLFTNTVISIVQVGEITGNIDASFEKLHIYYKKLDETKKSVQASLFYPTILVISIIALILFMNYYFIPQIMSMSMYNEKNVNAFAKFIFEYSRFSNTYKLENSVIIFSMIAIVVILILDIFTSKNNKGALYFLPIASNMIKMYIISNILWTYNLTLSSGIDIIKSTQIIKSQSNNKILIEKLSIFEESINSGESIKNSLDKLNINDDNIGYFISIGEESGTLDNSLKILSDMYYKKLVSHIKYVTQIIQPTLVIIITFIVGVLISTIILPMLDYSMLDL